MALPPSSRSATGRITVHARGFGFLVCEDAGGRLDAFIAPPDLQPFLADDLAAATVRQGQDGRWTAADLQLVERRRERIFGEVVFRRTAPWLRPDREVGNTDLRLEAQGVTLRTGDAVIARPTPQGAAVVRVLAAGEDRSLARTTARHDLREDFEPGCHAEARQVAGRPHALGARRDLRGIPLLTVDAAHTRDIDDAVAVLPAGPDGALRLLVAISDVGAFVPEGSVLDLAARDRATSVYLAGRTLPMFPEELSAGWLSLNPGVDRACLAAELRLDPEGTVTSVDVYEGLLRSRARLDYTETAAFLDRGVISPAMGPVAEAMPWLRAASARLAIARQRRGGVKMSREETRITFDAGSGEATGLESVRPTSAHAMIERFMVAANEAMAHWLVDRGVGTLFRSHAQPNVERVRDLADFARNFGFAAGFASSITPLALAAFEAQVTGADCEPALRAVLLRSLGPAQYVGTAAPHFGLAADRYLHFTSPIRRYADLVVHRTVKAYLQGEREFAGRAEVLGRLAEHVNRRARAASRAEADRRRTLFARLFASRVGEELPARVVQVRPFGLIVQLDGTWVEGVLPAETLPDGPYAIDDRETALRGAAREFAIGVPLRVRVASSDEGAGRIEFALAP